MDVVSKQSGKFEQIYITGNDAVMYFPSVQKAQKNPNSGELQYSVIVFVDSATREKLEMPTDEGGVFINKQFFEVGVDRNKKKKIKFPTSDQVEEGKRNFDAVKGMHGVSLTAPNVKKNGDKTTIAVVDKDGNPITAPIGTGSKGNFRCWGYRNADGQLNITLDLVQVTELVEGNSGGSNGFDDVLGVSVNATTQQKGVENMDNSAPPSDDDFDSDIPFN